MQRTELISELSQISKPLAENPVSTPFVVPAGYFDQLPGILLQRVRALEEAPTLEEETAALSSLLGSISKKMPFTLPETYFQELIPIPPSILAEQDGQLAADHSSLLQSLKDKPTYRVPAGYFEKLAGNIQEQLPDETKAPVVPISFGRKITRYAVAASVAAVMVVSGWFLLHKQQPLSSAGNGALANIEQVSNKELQDFIDQNTVILPDSISVVSSEIRPEDVKTMLAGIPDAELQQYIEQQPDLKDPALNNYN
ncbi:MAG: hypothetical protein INR73_15640 [Williamsia sp.]|nr:hypothetical protein [Williamsia sp.]